MALLCGELALEDGLAWVVARVNWLVLVLWIAGFEFARIDLTGAVVVIRIGALGVVGLVDVAHDRFEVSI